MKQLFLASWAQSIASVVAIDPLGWNWRATLAHWNVAGMSKKRVAGAEAEVIS